MHDYVILMSNAFLDDISLVLITGNPFGRFGY